MKKWIYTIALALALFLPVIVMAYDIENDSTLCIKRALVISGKVNPNTLTCTGPFSATGSDRAKNECIQSVCKTVDGSVNQSCVDFLAYGKYNGESLEHYLKSQGLSDRDFDGIDSISDTDDAENYDLNLIFIGAPSSKLFGGLPAWSFLSEQWKLDSRAFAFLNANEFSSCSAISTEKAREKKPPQRTWACCLNYNTQGQISSCQARPSPCVYTPNSFVQQHPLPEKPEDNMFNSEGMVEFNPVYKLENACQKAGANFESGLKAANLDLQSFTNSSLTPELQTQWKTLTKTCCVDSGVQPPVIDNGDFQGCTSEKLAVDDTALTQSAALASQDTKIPERPKEILFRPSVGFPGTDFEGGVLTTINAGTFGRFLGQFFGLALSIIAIFAILMIIIAGAKMYLAAARGNITEAAKAKDGIKKAITGLVFTLAAVTLFRFINPRLIEIPSLTSLSNKYTIEKEVINITQEDIDNESDGGKSSGSTQCKNEKYGASYTEARNNGKQFTIKTKNGEFKVTLNKALEQALARVNQSLATVDYGPLKTAGGYADKTIANSSTISNHHWGIAVDINPDKNRQYLAKNSTSWAEVTAWRQTHSGYNASCPTDMPEAFVKAFTNNGFAWGGAWKSTCDAMHFEYVADCSGTSNTNNNSGGGGQKTTATCPTSGESGISNSGKALNQKVDSFLTVLSGLTYQSKPWSQDLVKAQAILESDWGTSPVAKDNKNYFGMVCGSWKTTYPDKCASNGYRKYNSIQESLNDYYNTLTGSTWTSALKQTRDALQKETMGNLDIKYSEDVCQAAWFGFKHKTVIWARDANYSDNLVKLLNTRFGKNCNTDRSLYFTSIGGVSNTVALLKYNSCSL